MDVLPDPDWYLDNVLIHAEPGRGGRIEIGPAAQWQAWWSNQCRDEQPAVRIAREQGFVVATGQLDALGWGGTICAA